MGEMDEQKQVSSEGEQASRSSRNPSSGGSRSGAVGSPPPSSPQFVINSEEVGRPVAEQLLAPACSPVSGTHDVWGVLTAISDKAKSRSQGPQILLHNSEHVLGRLVKDPSCQFDSLNVSAKHCTIFRKRFKAEGCIPLHGTELVSGDRWLVYIKDSSSNGTFINCQKLKRDSPEARIKDGDIISLVNAPEHENAFAFLYQEIKPNALNVSTHEPNGSVSSALKRKSLYEGEIVGESNSGDSKRVKGLGIGGLDGPVSLDDVRRLQRSNEELRNQLEAHLLTIEKLRAESRAAAARHDAEIKELRETLSAAFLDQIQDLRTELGKKENELDSSTSLCVQQQSRLEDRNRSLAAAIQSRKDADEVIKSQKLNIVELKEQLEDERSQRRSERGKAEADLKAALERVRSEASEELKRQSESSAQQLREHLEMIKKLQEADRESRSLIEALRSKLEDTRETLVKAERTSRSLELRLQDEEASLAMAIKRITEKEQELKCATKEMQNEKAAKEAALARLSTVEVEMETAIHDLSVEQQRLQGARERIVLRETQLRAFHSTAEEVAMLQQKQQEQLKEMMRVLEDGEDECHVPARDHYNGNTTTQTRVEVDTQTREEDINALQESEQRMDNHTVNNDEEKEVAGDADSQTTASNFSAHAEPIKVVMEEYGDGDTQVDDCNEFVDTSRDAQAVLFPDDEQKGSEPSVPMGTEAGYTQVLEIESNYRYMNETQVLGNGRDEGVQTKVFAGYTQLLDTQSKWGSGKYLNETQLLDNGRDEHISIKGRKDGGGNTEFRDTDEQAGVPGGETLLLEDENDTEMGEWGRRVQAQLANQETKMSGIIRESELASPPDKRGVSIEPAIEHGVQGSEAWNQVDVASGKNVPATTVELITSEVAGSWAYSTPASVHCDDDGWSQSQVRVGGPERGSNDAHLDFDASQLGRGIKGMHPPQQKGRLLENIHGSLSPRTTAQHDKERRDLNVMLDIVAPEFSRLHGLGRVMETAPDSEDHTGEEEEEEEDDDDEVLKSDEDSAESEPLSQSVSVSARY